MRRLAGLPSPAASPSPTEPLPAARPAPERSAPTITLRRLGDPAPVPPAIAPERTDAHRETWVVRPGDHLWRIAEATHTRAWGRAPSDREVDPFWRTVVEANRPSLHDPGNPDLLFPGDRITVPVPPAAPHA
jgi:nucleoid-associated protein YgaU